MNVMRSIFPGALPLATALCLTTAAHAGGYATARFGGEHGHPASDHPTAIYYNPAGLALATGTRVYVEGLLIYRTASYDRPQEAIDNLGSGTPDEPDAIAANSGEAELANFLASPFLGVTSDLGVDDLAVGAGVYVPFGGQASWGTNDDFEGNQTYPGALDGPQRWSTIEGSQRALYVTAAGAYRLPGPRLSFGVGVNMVTQSLSLVRARNANGTDDLVSPLGQTSEGRSLIEGEDTGISLGAGLLWEPTRRVRVGLSYQSAPGFGESALEGSLTNKFGGGPIQPVPTEVRLSLPDSVRAGVAVRATDSLELRLSGDYTRWSVFESHCVLDRTVPDRKCAVRADGSTDSEAGGKGILVVIPRNWQDTYGVRVGGSYWMGRALELFGGLSFDSNAVPDETMDAGLMDMNKAVASLGARYGMMGGAMQLTASLTSVFYQTREVSPRADDDVLLAPSRNPDGAGTYSQSVNLLTVGVLYGF